MSFETRFTVSLNITFESMLDEPRPDATLLDVHPEVPGVYRTVKGAATALAVATGDRAVSASPRGVALTPCVYG